jgi:hypothetical protein
MEIRLVVAACSKASRSRGESVAPAANASAAPLRKSRRVIVRFMNFSRNAWPLRASA